MSDQRAWVKVWLAWLMDRDIQSLSYADKGRWLELLLLVAEHGTDGKWTCKKGVRSLPSLWRRGMTSRSACNAIARLPGVTLHWLGEPLHEFTIEFPNWSRYQVSSSTERVRRWRSGHVTEGVTVTPHVTKHRPSNETGEKERKNNPPTPRNKETWGFLIPDDPEERRRWEQQQR